MSKVDQSVVLAGMRMKNPVVVASGTFGFGREYSQFQVPCQTLLLLQRA